MNNDPNLNLIQKFDTITLPTAKRINAACKFTQELISEKLNLAKNDNQIRKMSLKIKSFIIEEIKNVEKIHQYCLLNKLR